MRKLLLLAGDGIGPEVSAEVKRVWTALAVPDLTLIEAPFGGTSYDQFGTPLKDEVRDVALASDAVSRVLPRVSNALLTCCKLVARRVRVLMASSPSRAVLSLPSQRKS